MSNIIDGRKIASDILAQVAESARGKNIGLGIIQVGNDPASNIYVKNKLNRASEVGINAQLFKLDIASQEELEELIEKLNADPSITGFFIQAPLPLKLNLSKAVSKISPLKDVDGMTAINLGKLFHGDLTAFVSATALAVMELLKHTVSLEGKHAVIVNRSTILGKPLAALLLNRDCTVTICHSKTKDLAKICKSADILITATGKPDFFTSDFIKEGAVVIDCGSPKAEVCFDQVSKIAGFISPVPGGVGPVTIACLLKNLVRDKEKLK